MRVQVIYQHAPTPGAPGIYRHRMLLAELVKRGWTVDLVSTPINYMHGIRPPGYENVWMQSEVIDGINHHWVRASANIHKSFKHRALNYVTFAGAALARASALPCPDVIWASSPPLSVASVGEALSLRFRRPWIFEARDLWPEWASAGGLLDEEGRLYRLIERFAHRYATKADAVMVPTPGLIPGLRKHGADAVTLVTGAIADNPPDAGVRKEVRRRLGVADNCCLFTYLGAHGILNGLDTLFEVVASLEENDPKFHLKANFILAGDGSAFAELQASLKNTPLKSLQMLGTVSREEAREILVAADVGLHLLRPDPMLTGALPTKVLEYVSGHRPFITTVPGLPGDIAQLSGGALADGPDDLYSTLLEWSKMPPEELAARGEKAFQWGQENHGIESTVDQLESLLNRVARSRARK